MKKKQKILQISLLSLGFILIFLIYYIYPKMNEIKVANENKIKKEIQTKNKKTAEGQNDRDTFEEVEYNGIFNINNKYTVTSEKAYILSEDVDMVYMESMKAILHLNDGRIITISSDSGKYSKSTSDCWFEDNVRAIDGETVMTSENLDLIMTNNTVTVYNDVVLNSSENSLKADKIDYNFDTKHYLVSMFNDEKIKIKLTR